MDSNIPHGEGVRYPTNLVIGLSKEEWADVEKYGLGNPISGSLEFKEDSEFLERSDFLLFMGVGLVSNTYALTR